MGVARDQVRKGYGQFCPVAKGAEIFAERWTPLVVRELLMGSRRFNDLRRGVPRMSQSLLTKRLKELEWAGIVERRRAGSGWEYHLTPSGQDLWPVVEHLGTWAYRWFQAEITEEDLDAGLLMLDIRRTINAHRLPERRIVVHCHYPDAAPGERRWWLVMGPDGADICEYDPGFPVDLTLETSLLTITRIWMGDMDLRQAVRDGRVTLEGPAGLAQRLPDWLGTSFFGALERRTPPPGYARSALGL